MNYETILVDYHDDLATITFNRVDKRNAINDQLLVEINHVMDVLEKEESNRFLVLQGQAGVFCTGMDFDQVTQDILSGHPLRFNAKDYMATLKRFTSTSKVVIAKVDGRVLAGGVGIVAACDLVFATQQAQFGLSEALWGLLPANVMPFLIRRVGYQKAYTLTLTTQNISAQTAYDIQLVDILADNLDDALQSVLKNLRRVSGNTVAEMKSFFKKMWIIDETMENAAMDELQKLIQSPMVLDNIKNFVLHQQLPWDKEK